MRKRSICIYSGMFFCYEKKEILSFVATGMALEVEINQIKTDAVGSH